MDMGGEIAHDVIGQVLKVYLRPLMREQFVPEKHIFEYIEKITVIRFAEEPTVADTKEIIDILAKNESYHLRLWDMSRIQFDFTMDEIRAIAKYGKSRFPEKNFFAAVAPEDLAFGKLRAFEVYRAEEGHSDVRVFRTESEAIEWLSLQHKYLGP